MDKENTMHGSKKKEQTADKGGGPQKPVEPLMPRTQADSAPSTISGRASSPQDLDETRNRYYDIYDAAPVGYFTFDKNGVIIEVNQTGSVQLGIEKTHLLKKPFRLYVSPESQDKFHLHRRKVLETNARQRCEITLVRTDGNKFDALLESIRVPDANGNFTLCLTAITDVTEQKKVEEALQASEERYRCLFEQAADAIVVSDSRTGAVLEFNDKAGDMLGYTREEFGKLSISDIEAKESPEETLAHIKKVVRQGSDTFETRQRKKDGTICDIIVSAKLITIGGKQYIQGIWRDITEQRIAEKRLLEYQKQLKRLAARLTLTEERERRRIARELHDQVSQSLALAKIKLDALCASPASAGLAETLKETSDALEKAIRETRSLTFDISYPILYELGFEAAVAEWLNEQVRDKHGIAVEFLDNGQPKPLDDDVRVLLFRNVRELLINVIKHADADKVKVQIRRVDENIEITVEDNGAGFDPSERRKGTAFGLFSIRESVEGLGGRFEIESRPGAGCKATIAAPLKGKSHKKDA